MLNNVLKDARRWKRRKKCLLSFLQKNAQDTKRGVKKWGDVRNGTRDDALSFIVPVLTFGSFIVGSMLAKFNSPASLLIDQNTFIDVLWLPESLNFKKESTGAKLVRALVNEGGRAGIYCTSSPKCKLNYPRLYCSHEAILIDDNAAYNSFFSIISWAPLL